MKRQQPYRFWSKNELIDHLERQSNHFGITYPIAVAVYDGRWNPLLDFDGCTLISDKYQPFLPCFIHDYEWITGANKFQADKDFRRNLLKCGVPLWKANLKFIAVRIAALTLYRK